jgi:putative transposase
LVHVVFSTKERRPFFRDLPVREEVHKYLGGIARERECQPIIVGGVEDDVHVLVALARTVDAATLVKELKRGSSIWIKTKGDEYGDFSWQTGYGIFSIGFSQLQEVKEYIANQEAHHRKMTFQEEFRRFLERYEIEFDERYVWE